MKVMTPTDCLDFVEGLSADDATWTEHRLARAMTDGEPGWLTDGLARGVYHVTTTHLNGHQLYRYVWHRNDQGRLHVNASLYVGDPGLVQAMNAAGKAGNDWLWIIGAEFIARQQNCCGIVFESQRRGHLEQAMRAGFKTAGVRMIKDLDNVPA